MPSLVGSEMCIRDSPPTVVGGRSYSCSVFLPFLFASDMPTTLWPPSSDGLHFILATDFFSVCAVCCALLCCAVLCWFRVGEQSPSSKHRPGVHRGHGGHGRRGACPTYAHRVRGALSRYVLLHGSSRPYTACFSACVLQLLVLYRRHRLGRLGAYNPRFFCVELHPRLRSKYVLRLCIAIIAG